MEPQIRRNIPASEFDPAIMEASQTFSLNSDYISDHYEELLAKHPGKWVAVYDERILAVGVDLDDLFRQIEARGVDRGVPAIEYFTIDPTPLIL